ncbi:MAG: NAD+ synthase [Planctomycetes bacterium]|nr:NAD+ synthase [Planctomycetota bacterium]
MATLRIALAQINPTVGDLAGNGAKIAEAMRRAREAGADLVTFPELAVSGYPPEDLLLKPGFLRDCRAALDSLVGQIRGIAAIVGFPDFANGSAYNAAALIHGGHLLGVYRKVELPNYGVFDEKRYFAPGTGSLLFEVNGVRLFVTICEDVWVAEGLAERLAQRNRAHVVVNISASPFHAGKLATRREVLAAFARRTGAYVCYNNLVGGQDELVFDGGSLVIDPRGKLAASAARFEEDMLLVDLAPFGKGEPVSPRDTSGQWGRRLAIESANSRGLDPVPPRVAPELDRTEEVYKALVLGTRDYVRKNRFKKVAIGLSGGVDSALTAAIAVDALGPANVVGVTMPSQFTSSETLSDAMRLAANLGISLLTIPIAPMFASYLEALEDAFGPGAPGIERENLQARIRGNILMALSNRHGWLVLTTGNKSEVAVGYCTLYGDTAGGFAVIKDVPKTLVWELAEHVNRKAGRDVIPCSIIERPPTAELKPNQKDEDSLPPYRVLDPILKAYVEEDKAPEELVPLCPDVARLADVLRRVNTSEYKRRQAPPGVKITPKAFGRDWRLPITNRYGNGRLKAAAQAEKK